MVTKEEQIKSQIEANRKGGRRRQINMRELDKTVKRINVSFTGKFFGYVFDRKVTHHASSIMDYSYMKLPRSMAGKVYTVIMIPKELNRKIFEQGERVDWNQFYDGVTKDKDFDKFRIGRENDEDKYPTKIEITDDEVRL